MILLVDNYDSFTFNLSQLIQELGRECRVVRNDALTVDGIAALAPRGIVLSPGPGRPEEAGVTLETIRAFAGKLPILGVCLGHQAIGQAFGAKVVRAGRLMHGKLSRVHHDGHGLYRGIDGAFRATRYHSLVVDRASLPECLEVSAQTEDGVVMGLRHRDFPVEGVQFHPESILTEHGRDLLSNFLTEAA